MEVEKSLKNSGQNSYWCHLSCFHRHFFLQVHKALLHLWSTVCCNTIINWEWCKILKLLSLYVVFEERVNWKERWMLLIYIDIFSFDNYKELDIGFFSLMFFEVWICCCCKRPFFSFMACFFWLCLSVFSSIKKQFQYLCKIA